LSDSFHHLQLDNGLTVVADLDPTAHTSAVGFFVRAGVRDETAEQMGVSHFLEHMMFKGTARRSAADVNRVFDEIGANYNASTSQETTCYWAHVLPRFLPDAIDLITDMLRPALRNEDFEVERKVILEEIGMYADRPFWIAYEQAMIDYYGRHALGYQILGTPETVEALTADQMRGYFEHRYSPDNLICAVAGRMDLNKTLDQLQAACGDWTSSGVQRTHGTIEPRLTERTMHRSSVNMHYLLGLCSGPADQDDDRYAAAVLSYVLGDSEGSRLYWRLIDPGLADEVEVSQLGFDQTGATMFYTSCPPENAEQVEAAFFDELARAGDDIGDDEVERAVSKMATSLTLRSERPLGRMMSLGGQWLCLGKRLTLDQELACIESVTAEDLRAVLAKHPLDQRCIVRLCPGENSDGEAV
jgi:predicted Zn-dependent peptidase